MYVIPINLGTHFLTVPFLVLISFGIIVVTIIIAFSNILRDVIWSAWTYLIAWLLVKTSIYGLWLRVREKYDSQSLVRETEKRVQKMKDEVRRRRKVIPQADEGDNDNRDGSSGSTSSDNESSESSDNESSERGESTGAALENGNGNIRRRGADSTAPVSNRRSDASLSNGSTAGHLQHTMSDGTDWGNPTSSTTPFSGVTVD